MEEEEMRKSDIRDFKEGTILGYGPMHNIVRWSGKAYKISKSYWKLQGGVIAESKERGGFYLPCKEIIPTTP